MPKSQIITTSIANAAVDTTQLAADAVDNTILDLADDYTFSGTIAGDNAGYTSGTTFDLTTATSYEVTGIPAGINHLIVAISNYSNDNSEFIQFQLGTSGGYPDNDYSYGGVTRYTTGNNHYVNAGNTTAMNDAVGIFYYCHNYSGVIDCRKINDADHEWVIRSALASNYNGGFHGNTKTNSHFGESCASVRLAAALTKIRIKSPAGNNQNSNAAEGGSSGTDKGHVRLYWM